MAVIAVYSVKGGVGKTTLSVDLAWRLATQSRRKTLLWDLDPQGGSGFLLGHAEARPQRAASIFHREGKPRQLVEPTAFENLMLMPADESLRGLSLQLARLGHRRRLATMTAAMRADYERIVLDCPAGASEVSDQVLAAADLVLVPLPASPLSARALDMVRRELTRLHYRHPPILPVLSMYDSRRSLHRQVASDFAAGWPVIPMTTYLEQVAVRRAPLGTFANHTAAGRALDRLWLGVEAKLTAMRDAEQRLHVPFSQPQSLVG
jgi:cellulose biosynthesis protein BcsQ